MSQLARNFTELTCFAGCQPEDWYTVHKSDGCVLTGNSFYSCLPPVHRVEAEPKRFYCFETLVNRIFTNYGCNSKGQQP